MPFETLSSYTHHAATDGMAPGTDAVVSGAFAGRVTAHVWEVPSGGAHGSVVARETCNFAVEAPYFWL